MSSIISSIFVQQCSIIPKAQLVSLSSPHGTKNHYPSSGLKCTGLKLRSSKNNGTFFTTNVSLRQQIHSQEDDAPTKLLIDSIGDCLYSFVARGETRVEYLGEALRTVDIIERLGIQRFFKQQIKQILESLYRKWNEKYGLTDAIFTTVGFRLLRLHGYHVNADVLKMLRDKDGGNFSMFLVENSNKECALMNLYKCSQIGFPQESEFMDEIEDFSKSQLVKLLSVENLPQSEIKKREEIKFSLSYPRRYLLARMEARSIVRGSWYSSDLERKCIELASIDLGMLQKVYQQEMIECERWFDEQRFENLRFPRLGVLNIYFGLAMSMFESQFSLCRLAFCKACILICMMDELHDNTAYRRGLNSFQEAFQRWDATLVENHHPHKAVLKSFRIFLIEMASFVSKAQGRDLFPYIKETWEETIAAYNKDIEWNLSDYFPTFDEYIKTGTTTYGAYAILSSITLFLTGEKISNNAFQLVSKDSRLLHLSSLMGRLANDLMTYEREAKEGQAFNAIACYMKDNKCTEQEAIEAIKKMRKDTFRELELELFNCRGITPEPCIRVLLSFVQHSSIIYRLVDSFKLTTDTEFQELVADYMGY